MMMTRRLFFPEENGVIHTFGEEASQSHYEEKLEEVESVAEENAEEAPLLVKPSTGVDRETRDELGQRAQMSPPAGERYF